MNSPTITPDLVSSSWEDTLTELLSLSQARLLALGADLDDRTWLESAEQVLSINVTEINTAARQHFGDSFSEWQQELS